MFTSGDYLLISSLIVSTTILLDMFLLKRNLTLKLLYLVFFLLSLAVGMLTYFFITGEFTVYYVWLYSNSATSFIYRVAGVWSGQEGTFLLWVWIIFLSLLLTARKYRTDDEFMKKVLTTGVLVGIFFLIVSMNASPFKSIYDHKYYYPAMEISQGNGLDPVLLNFWNTIHPPMTFIAYALLTMPFAFSFAHMWHQDRRWIMFSLPWLRLSWLFFAVGVGLIGGLWTYEAGWGIWAWDPVQTASIIPVFIITTVLHAASRKQNPLFDRLLPPLTSASFIVVILATFITRSGLWGSVHEFTQTSNNILLIGALVLSTAAILYLSIKKWPTPKYAKYTKGDNVFIYSAAIFILFTLILLIGLLLPVLVSPDLTITADFYNLWCYPLVIILLVLLGLCSLSRSMEQHVLQKTVGIIILTSGILAFIVPSTNFQFMSPGSGQATSFFSSLGNHLSILGLVPALVFASYGIFRRINLDLGKGITARQFGIHIIHFGIILALTGGVISTQFQEQYVLEFNITEIGQVRHTIGEYSVSVSHFIVSESEKDSWLQTATFDIHKNGRIIGSKDATYMRDAGGTEYILPSIIRGLVHDIKIEYHGLDPKKGEAPTIPVTISVVPLINLLWAGMAAIGLGAFIVFSCPDRTGIPGSPPEAGQPQ
ncbi:MAG: cytochrome c biogenesis protein CcsA [ANME-2 cluster archaeon]|nr:cytochrome c biogenesis protein CcsA [ANME-2 cluster archaeon]